MAPHGGKVCVKKILKLAVTNAALAACRIETFIVRWAATAACRTEMVKERHKVQTAVNVKMIQI